MSHRSVNRKGKIWSNSLNSKGKQREEEEIDELDPESESETLAASSATMAHHHQTHPERVSTMDMHPQWETISSTTASSKAGGKKTGKGHGQDKPTVKDNPRIPYARMESILLADPDNGPMSKEAIHLVLGATEHFIRRLSKAAQTRSKLEKRSTTTYKDVAETAYHFEEFNFLGEIIPRPIPLRLAMSERAKRLQQMGIVDEGAAADVKLSGVNTPESISSASTAKGKGKGKGRAIASNGRTSSLKQVNGDSGAYMDSHTNESLSTSLPRQKNKRARTSNANGDRASPMAPNSSANGTGGGMKIKIRPRSSASSHDRSAGVNGTKNGVLPLGPPSHFKTNGGSSKISDDVIFAPPGTTEAPLWTRVPLPPPPSPRTRTSSTPGTSHIHQNNRDGFPPGNANAMDYRSALSPNAPNPGRTIYSRR